MTKAEQQSKLLEHHLGTALHHRGLDAFLGQLGCMNVDASYDNFRKTNEGRKLGVCTDCPYSFQFIVQLVTLKFDLP